MESLRDQLKKNRPNLSETTIKTYLSILSSLYKKINGTGDMLKWYETNLPKVLDYVKDDKTTSRKTKLAVMVSLLSHKPEDKSYSRLKEMMVQDATKYSESLRGQNLTEKQKKNWMTQDEVMKVWKDLYKQASPFLKKEKLTKPQWNEALDLILLSLYVLQPPRRSKDYAMMKTKDYDDNTDNFYDGKKFYFNQYKTAKNYGEQSVKVSPKLNAMLKQWLKINKHPTLLATYVGKPLSVSRMTLLLNAIFGKNVASSMLRHIFLTDQYKDVPGLNKMDQLAEDMGHSVNEALTTYVKKV